MKLLWAKAGFLHPTNRGGQIRTLGMLRELHRRHEVHFVGLEEAGGQEGPQRAVEYATRIFPVPHRVTDKTSPRFALDLLAGLFSPLPVAVSRWKSEAMRRQISALRQQESYDIVICDFLFPAVNFDHLQDVVLFQHNVESIIWKRHTATSRGLRRPYFQLQHKRMFDFERSVCRKVAKVITVSEPDTLATQELYGVPAADVPTGVDTAFFRPPDSLPPPDYGIVFVGAMDWLPNIDGVLWFVREVLPRIRRRYPTIPVTIVGRTPTAEIQELVKEDTHLHVTGTVPDVRPYLWGARFSIVPLRIGGGTRLKIYESMAAGCAIVSTAIGAEGLDVADGETIALADTPEDFALRCMEFLEHPEAADKIRKTARAMVEDRYSWLQVTRRFEHLLGL